MNTRVANQTLVTGYVNPDLDAYACAAGYAELLNLQGKPAVAAYFGSAQNEITYTLDLLGEPLLVEQLPADFAHFVIVDTSDALHLPHGINPQNVTEVIDHHLYNDPDNFPFANLDIQAVGAAATLVAERFRAAAVMPRREIAALLYAAIISNTLIFKAAVTTDRDREAAAWLAPLADLPESFGIDLFKYKADVRGEKLRQLVELEMCPLEVHGTVFIIGALELTDVPVLLSERRSELEAIMHKLHTANGADVTFLSLSDVHLGKTFFISPYDHIQAMLHEVLEIQFDGTVAEYPSLILRKEYVGKVRRHALSQQSRGTFSPNWRLGYSAWPTMLALLAAPIGKLLIKLQEPWRLF